MQIHIFKFIDMNIKLIDDAVQQQKNGHNNNELRDLKHKNTFLHTLTSELETFEISILLRARD